jgi:hypothetical protein
MSAIVAAGGAGVAGGAVVAVVVDVVAVVVACFGGAFDAVSVCARTTADRAATMRLAKRKFFIAFMGVITLFQSVRALLGEIFGPKFGAWDTVAEGSRARYISIMIILIEITATAPAFPFRYH